MDNTVPTERKTRYRINSRTDTSGIRKAAQTPLLRAIILSVIPLLTCLQTKARAESASGHKLPKLVVCIQVDQLRTDRLLSFSPAYGNGGLQRFLSHGLIYPVVDFGTNGWDAAAALASIHTGTYPWINGIPSSRIYDTSLKAYKPIEQDNNYIGNYTSERVSPLALRVETVGDELKTVSSGRSLVYSIAPNAAEALYSAGHTADGAYWIDDSRSQWATTTFYTNPVPWYVDQYNRDAQSLNKRISSMTWIPLLPIRTDLIPYGRTSSFSHKIGGAAAKLKQSALINEEVTNLALLFIQYAGYDQATVPNLLNITYYAGSYGSTPEVADGYGPEMLDTYRRLDIQLARLLSALDKKLGAEAYTVMLIGTGQSASITKPNTTIEGKTKGVFDAGRAKALLNLYLMAIYGQADWVADCQSSYVYLNHKTIEKAQIDLTEITTRCTSFLREMSGVQQAIPTAELYPHSASNESLRWARAYSSLIGADILLDFVPGWIVESGTSSVKQAKTQRYDAPPAPLIFLGSGFKHKIMQDEIPTVDRIAPTLAFVMRIRPPSAATAPPLTAAMIPIADTK